MKISVHSFAFGAITTLVVVGIAIWLGKILGPGNPSEKTSPTVPNLATYGVDIRQTSVSGVSSGGAMAVQMHVAHSSIMRGVGVIGGVAYDCTNSSLSDVNARLMRGVTYCMTGTGDANADFSIGRTTAAAAIAGAIDSVASLAGQKVWLFSGYNDGAVRRAAMDAVAGYYEHYVGAGNIFYQTGSHAPHALITDGPGGGQCLAVNNEFINNCSYDSAGYLLKHIYGSLTPPSSSPTGSILEFDQSEFTSGVTPKTVGLADSGFVYVPNACLSQSSPQACRVHVVFHGCLQYTGRIGKAVVEHGGYNKWADTNRLIVLYPQAVPTSPTIGNLGNPTGCWDWWGYTDLPRRAEYARKTGYQISAIKAMLDRLAGGFAPAVAANSVGLPQPPQNASVVDRTSRSLALIWQPSAGAAGFKIYRSNSEAGPYVPSSNNLIAGGSFADRQLNLNTTYFYQISAVDKSGVEGPPSSAFSGTTAATDPPGPPVCDPYFGSNQAHILGFRAYQFGFDAYAWGSRDLMGPATDQDFSQLLKDPQGFYHVGYCP